MRLSLTSERFALMPAHWFRSEPSAVSVESSKQILRLRPNDPKPKPSFSRKLAEFFFALAIGSGMSCVP